jgi:hypothetical protein
LKSLLYRAPQGTNTDNELEENRYLILNHKITKSHTNLIFLHFNRLIQRNVLVRARAEIIELPVANPRENPLNCMLFYICRQPIEQIILCIHT